MTAQDKSKLDGIESGADSNPTNAETKSAYEANPDTNAFTNVEQGKLSGIDAGAEVNENTNLGNSRGSSSVTVTSSTGSNTTLNAASTSQAGVMSAADKSFLDNTPTVFISDDAPTSSDGNNGDVWLEY